MRRLTDGLGSFLRDLIRPGCALLCAVTTALGSQLPAGKGLVEAGAPAFVVLGSESIGLTSAPTDLRLMPDGRLLLVASRQLAMGDGVRWEVFRQDPADTRVAGQRAAVDAAGVIYLGTPEGVARVDFQADGQWRLTLLAPWTAPGVPPQRLLPESGVDVVGQEWLWHTLTGAIFAWRPGQVPRVAGYVNTFECLFELDGSLYLSDRAGGALQRLGADKMEPIRADGSLTAITCAQPFDQGRMLVGTYGSGLQFFDGQKVTPFPAGGILASGIRINDLSATTGDYFAAAVDNYGIVFFDRTGHIVQSLDRSLDQRLSRVKFLVAAPGGVVWGLIEGGLVRAGFPSRISYFEPLLAAGLTTAHPHRFNGRLWWLVDGKTYQGTYGPDDRLVQLRLESPDKLFVNSFSGALGLPVVGTEQGAFYFSDLGWVPFAPEVKNLHILDPTPTDGRWLYCALDEVGWLQRNGNRIEIMQRYPAPGLTNVSNNPVKDAQGRIWLELGIGRVARVQLDQGRPVARVFSAQDGVPSSWPQTFEFEGNISFNFSDQIYRFDEGQVRFVPAPEFIRQLPGLKSIFGRPGLDAKGQLWVSADGELQVFDKTDGRWTRSALEVTPGFLPYYFTFEDDGVVWMHSQHRLARYHPVLPEAPPVALRAQITRATIGRTQRGVGLAGGRLPTLGYEDNSLSIFYVAAGGSPVTAISFEVKLDGTGSEWVNNGSAGSAAFGGLKEGNYRFHVRPRAGSRVGTEATLDFTIRPPWFRTPLAYVGFGLGALGVLWLATTLTTVLQRRENTRLERLVQERTAELNQSNARLNESNRQLAGQVQEIRLLSAAIEQSPAAVFLTRPDGTIGFANPCGCTLTGYPLDELIGMNLSRLHSAIVPQDVLESLATTVARGESWSGQLAKRHKDGRVVQVRSTISPIRGSEGAILHHLILEEDITESLAARERSHRLEAQLFQAQKMESIGTLAGGIAHDFNNILTGILGYCELSRLAAEGNLEVAEGLQQIRIAGLRAKDLVAQILTFSRQSQAKLVPLDLGRTVAEALKLIRASTPATIDLVQNLESGTVRGDPTQIHQIVVNLCTNAIHAMSDRAGRLKVSVRSVVVDDTLAAELPTMAPGPCLRLTVSDTGHGMDPETVSRIFDPFFTTKPQGEGTGLGLAIVQGVVASHGGAVSVQSQVNVGTTFSLYFPLSTESPLAPPSDLPPPRGLGQEILVVDDEEQVASFISARLQQFGYRPFVFSDPRKALLTFQDAPARFSAVVTDLTMPHLTGLDLLRQVRLLRPSMPIVIITGYGRELTGVKLDAIAHSIVLQKPFSGEELGRALRSVLESVQPARPSSNLDRGG